jgi:hypothetical protein
MLDVSGRISISCNRIPLSLTPGFSRVLGVRKECKRFQPFPALLPALHSGQAVETALAASVRSPPG